MNFLILLLSLIANDNLKSGRKIKINDDYHFSYVFSTKPKMGQDTVVKIALFKGKEKVTDLDFFGSYDMPAMKGHHASGVKPFAKNKNNEYLLPLNLVMPGKWVVDLQVEAKGQKLFSGSIPIEI
jgi:hypothetical protein